MSYCPPTSVSQYSACKIKMSFISSTKSNLKWSDTYFARVIKSGPIPYHVAFILDGNRRWARENKKDVMQGHKFGLQSLHNVTQFLKAAGTKEITLYAFSIENFKRNKHEVDNIMGMLDDTLEDILDNNDNDLRIRLIGDMTLLPLDLQKKVTQVMEHTKSNTTVTVNLAVAYTCRDDLNQSIKNVLRRPVKPKDITVDLLDQNLYTGPISDVDILIRTSGETRLSDFLMWETSNTWICFLDKMWPELNSLDVFMIFLKYQRFYYQNLLQKK